ncbi:hypothetical protein LOZ53_002668 [Ophidiomyces ophidiicola]|uniref:Uncharacterized protein n=1 Tax=Ophidiomyces ophidiicola TaxID=1387563 RepID=A0ACB8USA8_9EURO|nr:hypothetical protein LOZ61_004944 [Ophidiomyces ophidiicola]KAI1923573.1 hypothetical protein LOZ60_005107 [Ophidiomyces ophidiicola]KAI1952414.1 hypothetical protein LOZ62_001363 [Ophidiomyces ophidiicola]KAI1954570.1 hypothetical protein LOZ59_004858 [Ophidiomyces ophidiicola]KAI1969853.1 hypothetical protein LOZ56_004101 [Ophidiomyces ophidiicola]
MAPSEDSILTNFLVTPSPLPAIISLEEFIELFPKKLRSHPQIKTLYRELQHVRAQDIALVKENIEREIKNGEQQKEELRHAFSSKGVQSLDPQDKMEINMDVQLFGESSAGMPEDTHTLESLTAEMQKATAAMEKEIANTQQECSDIMVELNSVISDLSDLRYGKFNALPGANSTIAEDVVAGLKNLDDACNTQGK